MFLNDLLASTYLKEEEPQGQDEIILVPGGLKPGIDFFLVAPRAEFESVLVKYRATEPASEGILMSLGKATSKNDPVWNIMMLDETVIERYTDLCNKKYMHTLEHLNGAPKEDSAAPEESSTVSEETQEVPEATLSTPEEIPAASEDNEVVDSYTTAKSIDESAVETTDTESSSTEEFVAPDFVPPTFEAPNLEDNKFVAPASDDSEDTNSEVDTSTEEKPEEKDMADEQKVDDLSAEDEEFDPFDSKNYTRTVEEEVEHDNHFREFESMMPDFSDTSTPSNDEEKSASFVPTSSSLDSATENSAEEFKDSNEYEAALDNAFGADTFEMPDFKSEDDLFKAPEVGTEEEADSSKISASERLSGLDEDDTDRVPHWGQSNDSIGFTGSDSTQTDDPATGFTPTEDNEVASDTEPEAPAPVKGFVFPASMLHSETVETPAEKVEEKATSSVTNSEDNEEPTSNTEDTSEVTPVESDEDLTYKKATSSVIEILSDVDDAMSEYGIDNVCATKYASFTDFVKKLAETTPKLNELLDQYPEGIPSTVDMKVEVLIAIRDNAFQALVDRDYDKINGILGPVIELIYEE